MPTVATKLSSDLASKVKRAAAGRKTTVSSYVRQAVENEVAERPKESFKDRFGHLLGVAKSLPSNASVKEGYED